MRRNALMAFDLSDRVCIQWPGVENMTRRCTCQIPLHVNGMRPVERWSRTLITPAAAWEFCRRIGSVFQTGTLNRCLTVPVFEVIKHGLQMCWKLKDRSSCDGHGWSSHVAGGRVATPQGGAEDHKGCACRESIETQVQGQTTKNTKGLDRLDHRKPDTRCVSYIFETSMDPIVFCIFAVAKFCGPLRCFCLRSITDQCRWKHRPTERHSWKNALGPGGLGKFFVQVIELAVSIPQPVGSCFRLQNWLSRMDPKWFSSVCQNLG